LKKAYDNGFKHAEDTAKTWHNAKVGTSKLLTQWNELSKWNTFSGKYAIANTATKLIIRKWVRRCRSAMDLKNWHI
jgi:hypothetical protein